MMMMDRIKKKKVAISLFGISIAFAVIITASVILSYLTSSEETNGGSFDRKEDSPSNYSGLTLTNSKTALKEANEQLSKMDLGNIQTIDGQDDEYSSTFFFDYGYGGITYWELEDPSTTVRISAKTGEIIYYNHREMSPGNLTEDQILEIAEDIIGQFSPIPEDRETGTSIEFYADQIVGYCYNEDTGEITSESELSSWEVCFNRTKDDVMTEDVISVSILPNGDCKTYDKVWNMDLDHVSTSCSVTEKEARDAAISFLGGGEVVLCEKKIVRPNYLFSGDIVFGIAPMCVWEVSVEDSESHLNVVQINGNDVTDFVGGNGED